MTTHHVKTSVLLNELKESFQGDVEITVSEVLRRLDGRAFGLLLFILAAPNCIPNIPGISTIFGTLLIAPALQMIFGAGQIWLPKKVREYKIEPTSFRNTIIKTVPILEKIEKWIKPRFEFLTEKPVSIFLGVQVLILAVILLLPIPFANFVPGLSIAFLALGLLQRDGVLIIISFLLFLLSFFFTYIGVVAGVAALKGVYNAIFGIFS